MDLDAIKLASWNSLLLDEVQRTFVKPEEDQRSSMELSGSQCRLVELAEDLRSGIKFCRAKCGSVDLDHGSIWRSGSQKRKGKIDNFEK